MWLGTRRQAVPPSAVVYDVETGLAVPDRRQLRGVFHRLMLDPPTPQEPWLIGAMELGHDVQQWHALDEDAAARRRMFTDFLEFVEARGGVVCSWSGNGFDDRAVEAGIKRWCPSELLRWKRVIKLDLCKVMRSCMEVPNSWSMKAVAAILGFRYTDSGWDGLQAGMAYEAYLRFSEPFDFDGLCGYNAEDVMALSTVYEWYATAGARRRRTRRNGPGAKAPRTLKPRRISALGSEAQERST